MSKSAIGDQFSPECGIFSESSPFLFLNYGAVHFQDTTLDQLRDAINQALSDYSSPWRIVSDGFAPISDEQQVQEIDAALKVPLQPVKDHLENALRTLRAPTPTAARDSIRESKYSFHAIQNLM